MDLDCTSFETTLESVSGIVRLSPDELIARLHEIPNVDTTYSDPDEWVPQALLQTLQFNPMPETAIWFHATRIPRGTTFCEGLLPTSLIRPTLERQLQELAAKLGLCPEDEWDSLPRQGHDATRLRWKANQAPSDDGPHGFLFREMIVEKISDAGVSSIADYTGEPEIVKEICSAIPSCIGGPVLAAYRELAHRAIVKFRYAPEPLLRVGALKRAVKYLHATLHGDRDWDQCSYGCDCKGRPVPRDDVLSIEFLA